MSNRHEEKQPRRPIREHLPFEDLHFGDIEHDPAAEAAANKAAEAANKAEVTAAVAADKAKIADDQAIEKSVEKDLKKEGEKDIVVRSLMQEIEELMEEFIYDYDIDTNMTGKERQRLFGAGVRNFGFIEKSYDIALQNPNFTPRDFNIGVMRYNIIDLEDARQLFWVLQQFQNAVNEYMLKCADDCFRDALRVYGNLRELNRSKVPGADVLFRTLLTYFRRRRPRPGEAEPTDKELERDFMKLIHGSADGEIHIINDKPHFTEGVRKVVDNVHTGHEAIKENAQVAIDEGGRK